MKISSISAEEVDININTQHASNTNGQVFLPRSSLEARKHAFQKSDSQFQPRSQFQQHSQFQQSQKYQHKPVTLSSYNPTGDNMYGGVKSRYNTKDIPGKKHSLLGRLSHSSSSSSSTSSVSSCNNSVSYSIRSHVSSKSGPRMSLLSTSEEELRFDISYPQNAIVEKCQNALRRHYGAADLSTLRHYGTAADDQNPSPMDVGLDLPPRPGAALQQTGNMYTKSTTSVPSMVARAHCPVSAGAGPITSNQDIVGQSQNKITSRVMSQAAEIGQSGKQLTAPLKPQMLSNPKEVKRGTHFCSVEHFSRNLSNK